MGEFQSGALERSGRSGGLPSLRPAYRLTPSLQRHWRFVGPTNIGGRVVDIAVDPVAAETIYVAAATGWHLEE
jgi:hypothetical protein